MTQLARIPPTQQLLPIDLVNPGRLGLNTVQAGSLMSTDYCTIAQNCVIDTSGRLGARFAVATYSATGFPVANITRTVFEYNAGAGTYQQIAIGDNGTNQQVANSWNNLTAAAVVGTANLAATTQRWWLQNFNNKLIAFQNGQSPVVYSVGTPAWNLVVATQGSVKVSNGVGCAAFGRIWSCRTDGQTIDYCGLLDETDWGSASSGTIDMRTIWADGTDQVTAIFHFNASLVVCGSHHIVMFTDGRGSLLGLDPTQMYVFDLLIGTGCTSQWTVDYIGETDVVYLSPDGVQSLQRLLTDRNNPTASVTKFVRDQLIGNMTAENMQYVSGAYNQATGLYLLSMPASHIVYCLDMRRRYNDEVGNLCAVVTTWPITTYAVAVDHLNGTYFGITGKVGNYTGYTDYTGVSYTWLYQSPIMSFNQQEGEAVSTKLKMLKRFTAYVYTAGNVAINLSWITDFGARAGAATVSVGQIGAISQYGLGQYGIAQYGGGSALTKIAYPARARGQYYQIGISAAVTGGFSLQQIQLATKIGRVA